MLLRSSDKTHLAPAMDVEQFFSFHIIGKFLLFWRNVGGNRRLTWKCPLPCAGLPNSKRQHLKVFATKDAAETWLQENDPEGVAFEYEVLE
jgi:hypothetical protein